METQSDDNKQPKLVCRKCGGPHFTLKCGKDSKEKIQTPPIKCEQEKQEYIKPLIESKKEKVNNKLHFKTTYKVKISELPLDITEEELMILTSDWGHIVKIRLNMYDDSAVSYIEFGYEEEADYFVKALDRTPFEHVMLIVERVN